MLTIAAMSSWKNRLLLSLMPSWQPSSPSIRRILVVSTTALGDTLWATPALANLRMHLPFARIAVLTSPTGFAALQHNPHIDQFYVLKEPVALRFFSYVKKLKKETFDAALIFHASQRLILPLCHFCHIPRIIATTGINKGLDDLITDPIKPCYEHEIERRLHLVQQLGAPSTIRTLSYYVQNEERLEVNAFIGPTKKKLVAIHPGSKEAFRRWPAKCFALVGRSLKEQLDCDIFLTGSASEEALLKQVQTHLPEARIVPSYSIRFLGAFLERMDLLLSNDTGPFHLACALNRPTVGLYVSTDPAKCGPYLAPSATAIARSTTCQPCLQRRCKDPFCFLQISPQEVVETALKLLI